MALRLQGQGSIDPGGQDGIVKEDDSDTDVDDPGATISGKMKKWTYSLGTLLPECLGRRILVMVSKKTGRTKSKGFVG